MKYCNLNCKYIHTSIIERCGEGIGYECRCMAQKGMPKITTDTYCPYDELSETKQETNIEIKELEEELCTLRVELEKNSKEIELYKTIIVEQVRIIEELREGAV